MCSTGLLIRTWPVSLVPGGMLACRPNLESLQFKEWHLQSRKLGLTFTKTVSWCAFAWISLSRHYAHTNTHMHIQTWTHERTHTYEWTHTHAHAHIIECTHKHAHAHTHEYTQTNTRTHSVSCQLSTPTFHRFVTPARNDVWTWFLHWKEGLQ